MRFAIVGGDERSAILAGMLEKDGNKVKSFALEKAKLPCESGCLQGCVYGADCVILPIPAEKNGLLNCPLSDERLSMAELMDALWPQQMVLGGNLSRELLAQAQRDSLFIRDIMKEPAFVVGNAALTAEAALQCLMEGSKSSLWQEKVLVLGWGRIAKLLALRLMALGAKLCIGARSEESLAMAQALGCEAVELDNLEEAMGSAKYIVNTIPARIISDSALYCINSDAMLLELASLPGGFDRNLAENLGLNVRFAPGLPGKCAPYSAAKLMYQAVNKIINRWED